MEKLRDKTEGIERAEEQVAEWRNINLYQGWKEAEVREGC